MRPAFSVIFLTTLIGAGQGLFLALYAAELGTRASKAFFVAGSAASVTLAALGLLASFFHLGRPEKAWRSAAMWRTSWLSREVIALPLFMALAAAYGAAHHFGWAHTRWIGAAAAVACVALFYCTSMVYACIRFLQEWASGFTIANFFLIGCASGFTLATAFAFFAAPDLWRIFAVAAGVLTLLAFASRAASLHRNARIRPKSTLQSATGIRHPKIAQKAQGSMGGSFNTREFLHGKRQGFLRSVKWIFLALAFPVPLLLLASGLALASATLLAAAFASQYLGLIAERWFFFAQANHPQNLYYQVIS